MPTTLLISAASAGGQGLYGTTQLTNVAVGFFSAAPDFLALGNANILPYAPTGAWVILPFTDPWVPYTTEAKHFPFGVTTSQPLYPPPLSHPALGTPTLTLGAQGLFVEGIDQLVFGTQRVALAVETANLLFIFAEPYLPPPYHSVMFPFGQQQVVLAGGADFSGFGLAVLTQQLGIVPEGQAMSAFGVHRVALSATGNLEFNFTEPYTPPLYSNTNFPFGDAQLISTQGLYDGGLGVHALALATPSVDCNGSILTQWGYGTRVYAYPQAGGVDFPFNTAGAPAPSASNVPFPFADIKDVAPTGWEFTQFGGHTVWLQQQLVSPEGVTPATLFGVPSLNPTILPTGQEYSVIGGHTLTKLTTPGTQTLAPTSWLSTAFGNAWVSLNPRYLNPPAFHAPEDAKFGAATVTHYIRHWVFEQGNASTLYGATTVTLKHRVIYPSSTVITNGVSWPEVYLGQRPIAPIGFEPLQVGVASIHDPTQWQAVTGIPPADAFGEPWVSYKDRTIDASAFHIPYEPPSPYAKVWNSRQYIKPFRDYDTERLEGAVGEPSLELFNKTIGAYGLNLQRFGYYVSVYNNARLVQPEGVDSLAMGQPTVSPNPQFFRTEWYDFQTGVVPTWHFVWLQTQFIETWGISKPLAQVGRPYIYSNTQWISPTSFGNEAFGTAYIDYAVRTLYPRHGYDIPWAGEPFVSHRVRTLAPIIPSWTGFGLPYIEEKFNRFIAWQFQTDSYGTATVWNNTPEVKQIPFDSLAFGKPKVFNLTQYWSMSSMDTMAFGRPFVEFKIRTVKVFGTPPPAITLLHKVFMEYEEVYVTQRIDLDNHDEDETVDGYGIDPDFPVKQIPNPRVASYGILNAKVSNTTIIGRPSVYGNGVLPEGIRWLDDYMPMPVITWQQSIKPRSLLLAPTFGKPAVSPFYVFPPSIDPPRSWPVGYNLGVPQVNTRDRTVRAYGPQFTDIGYHKVETRTNEILPESFNRVKWGMAWLNATQVLEPQGTVISVIGEHLVTRQVMPLPQFITPPALYPDPFTTTHKVELLNRPIYPASVVNEVVPTKAWLSYSPRTLAPVGTDMQSFGTQWVSLRDRPIYPKSWLSFRIGYTMQTFDKRLRVFRAQTASGSGVGTWGGEDFSGIGQPKVTTSSLQLIVPFTINTPPIARPSVANPVRPAGFECIGMGEARVERVIANTLQAHGELATSYGLPALARTVSSISLNSGWVGEPRVTPSFTVAGTQFIGFGAPALTNEMACGRNVIPAPSIDNDALFGIPEVL